MICGRILASRAYGGDSLTILVAEAPISIGLFFDASPLQVG
ncbi:hypothetical protein [Vibrio vulnificus YJ016]|uniref:Uncharacterized protein n=1 Tax=Vibrio vulnificus (strain YJ016) TaxID=196600 RepID=Q7MJ51_VIBVY|nr:hypothetical protein [Vibrio vulnificus YJ016]